MATTPLPPETSAALAPAAVGLALFVSLTQIRMDDPWAVGVLFLVAVIPAGVVLALALYAAGADDTAGGAATALVAAGLLLAAIALARLGQVLAGDDWSEHGGTLTLMLVLFTATAAYWCRETGLVAALLVAALAGVGLLLEAVNWIFSTEDTDVFRALLALAFAALFVAGLSLPGRPGTILVAAAGVTVLASSYALGLVFAFVPGGPSTGWGWELILLLEGCALAIYAVVQLQPGPGYLAFFALAFFVMTAAAAGETPLGGNGDTSHSLVGWPLTLLIGTAAAAAWGLRARPTR